MESGDPKNKKLKRKNVQNCLNLHLNKLKIMSKLEIASPMLLNAAQQKQISDSNNRFKMTAWLFTVLPAAWFMGVRVKSVSSEKAEVTLPYHWRSQNPFQSIYLIAQCAAAELSTGILCTLALQGRGKISMLATHIESDFLKKANTLTTFTCDEGAQIFTLIDEVIATGEARSIILTSKGVQKTGETVSVTRVTWSFKSKK